MKKILFSLSFTLVVLFSSVSSVHAALSIVSIPISVTGSSAVTANAGPDINMPTPQAGQSGITGTSSSIAGAITSTTWTYVNCTLPGQSTPQSSCPKSGFVVSGASGSSSTLSATMANMDGATVGTHFTYKFTATDSAGNSGSDTMDFIITAPSGPDLTSSYNGPSTASIGTVTLSGVVTNIGSAATGSSFTSYFEVCPTASTCGSNTWTSPGITLAAGASQTVSVTRSMAAGTYQVRLCADGTGAVSETDEGNNCSTPWTALNVTTPVNGVCAATHYNCTSGASTSNTLNGTQYTWICTGSNGGSDSGQCTENATVNGSCGAAKYTCNEGTATSQGQNSTSYTWSCSGVNGGSTVQCSAAITGTACSDGIDNDGDGKIDMQDPGCSSPSDNSEVDPKPIFIEF